MFVDFFIRRPVFATVCALLIILAGAICIPNLPVEMYPNLAPPVVSVTAVLCGRRRGDRRKGRHDSAGRGDQRRAGDALHQLVEHEQRRVRDQTSPSKPDTTWTSRPWTCRTAWPAWRAACPARWFRRASRPEIQLQFRLRRGILHARRALLRRIHFQLPGRLRRRRAQARARRGRCGRTSARASTPCACGSIRCGWPPAA